jgi:hypothetical protein
MANPALAERWIAGFEEGFGRKPTPEEEQRIRERADEADPNNPGILVWPRDPNMKLPTVEEYRQRQIKLHRYVVSKLVEHCREAGEPEPDQAKLAEWEASLISSRGAEMMVERVRVSLAWEEARRAGDPTALKCEAEFVESIANREWDVREHTDMINKWYVGNRGELEFPTWQQEPRKP